MGIYEMIKRANKSGLLQQAGWHRNFIDCYIYDYDWLKWNTFTKDELEELKSFQKDMREALNKIEKARYERYRNGKITREDIVRLLDREIASNVNQWGEDYIYTRWAREHKEKVLYAYDNNLDAVEVCKIDSTYSNGYDYEEVVFTDGTTKTYMYGAY